MSPTAYVLRALRHHAKHHVWSVVGTAVAGGVLIAALYVGDSVGAGLEDLAQARRADVGVRVESGGAPLRAELAEKLRVELGRDVAPVWHLQGVLSSRDGGEEVDDVHVYGVTNAFWNVVQGRAPPAGVHRLNEALRRRLTGANLTLDALLFRSVAQSAMAHDTPMGGLPPEPPAVEIWGTVYDGPGARLGPAQQSREPSNVFVPLQWLQEGMKLGATANELWVAGHAREHSELSHRVELGLMAQLETADLGLHLQETPQGVRLSSDSLLLPPEVARRALALSHNRAHLTWFIDHVRAGERISPFVFAAAVSTPHTGELSQVADGEVLVNQWLADELDLATGDSLELRYHTVADQSHGEPRGRKTVRVAGVLPMRGLGADRDLTPRYPGMAEAERCRDWDPGVPVDRSRIRDIDERYWQQHRAAPKVLMPLAMGQAMWSSRFGDLNEVRFSDPDVDSASRMLLSGLSPAQLGLRIAPVARDAALAATPTTDLTGLFLGFAGLLVVAALWLTGLLFGLGLEHRSEQIRTLRCLGLGEGLIRSMGRRESLGVAAVGALGGLLLAPVLAQWALGGLRGVWSVAVGGMPIALHTEPVSALAGGLATFVLAALVQDAALRRLVRVEEAPQSTQAAPGVAYNPWWLSALLLGLCGGGLAAVQGAPGSTPPAATFFGAGGLFIVAALSLSARWLMGASARGRTLSGRVELALRGAQRRPGRSLAVVSSLALTTFLVMGVGAHVPPEGDAQRDNAGATGGYELLLETTSPIRADLRHDLGRERLGLAPDEVAGVTFTPLRLRDGDDASCLNLGQAHRPRLLGVDPEVLSERGSFRFIAASNEAQPWRALEPTADDPMIPVIGDEATLRWGLGLGLGDVLHDVSETGAALTYRVVGVVERSFLQGALFVADDLVATHFPHGSSIRGAMVDAPPGRSGAVREALGGALGDLGVRLDTTTSRLARFASVETTYMRIFLAIGLLGVLLGACSVAVLLARHGVERRGELAVLRAIGQSRLSLWGALSLEHFALVAAGLSIGAFGALIGLSPGLAHGGADAALGAALILGGICLASLAVTAIVAWWSLQGEPAQVLAVEPT